MKKMILAMLLFCGANASFATYQTGDIFKYAAEELRTPVLPLEGHPFIAEKIISLQSAPRRMSTGNYRGYVATWEIQGNELYLVEFEVEGLITAPSAGSKATAESSDSHKKATLEFLFPGKVKNGRVLADWFSGTIFTPGRRWGTSLPKEEQEKQEAEASLIINVEKGKVIKVEDRRVPTKAIDSDKK